MKKISYIENFDTWVKEFQFSVPIKVRFSETDMFGHLNNTVPFIYFEQARIEFLHTIGFMNDWMKKESETIPVVADLQCDFLAQMYFGDVIHVFVKVHHIGNSSIDIHYLGKKDDGSICFTGRGAMVNLNKKSGKGHPWSEEERMQLENSKKILL